MSLLDINLNDVPDVEVLDPAEYQVKVEGVEVKTSEKSGNSYINMRLVAIDEPNAEPIYHILMLPTAEDDDRTKNNRLRSIRDAFVAFDCDPSDPDPDNLKGKVAWALVGQKQDEEYGLRNTIRRFR